MCGRFDLHSSPEEVARALGAELSPSAASFTPRYNIAPTTSVLMALEKGDHRVVQLARWGFYAPWKPELPLFNARSETAPTKSSFALAFSHRRAVVPADGFYEWRREKGKRPEPHYFTRSDGKPLFFGALWAPYDPGEEGDLATTILTTPASTDMAEIHDRMPVILEPDAVAIWLESDDGEAHRALCAPASSGTLVHRIVNPAIGRADAQGPSLLETPAPPPVQGSLLDM